MNEGLRAGSRVCYKTRFEALYGGGPTLANHKSAAKRARQSIRKNKVNTSRKNAVRTHEKNLVKALSAKDTKSLPELLKTFTSQAMKAAQRGLFKKESAARKIGRLSARVQAVIGK